MTMWHRILGKLLELLLTSWGITVHTDFKLMSEPPRSDILLLRRTGRIWTDEQRARLPDGVRDTMAHHILLEFKYTESLTHRAMAKILGYDVFYKESQNLSDKKVQSFILSAKTPQPAFLTRYGYQVSELPGVYWSDNVMLAPIGLLVLNELRHEPHNAFVKCFASRHHEKEVAFELLAGVSEARLSAFLWAFLAGLQRLVIKTEEVTMKKGITPDDVIEIGKGLESKLLATLSVEKRLQGLRPEERLLGLKLEERLLGLKPEERLRGLRPEERLLGLKPEERLQGLKPEERLRGLRPEEVLAQYKPEEVLAQYEPYLAERQQQVVKQTLQHTIQRTLELRFKLVAAQVETVKKQVADLTVADLEQLSEVAVQAQDMAVQAQDMVAFQAELNSLVKSEL